ncbi:MAG: hypothetical protein M3167_00395 [Acidobacteriota bacterium]|nr:hypothetical protein [Acidobacteriota bacterium]
MPLTPPNPYQEAHPPGAIAVEHHAITQTVLTDPDGTTTPIGATEETVLLDPATGARRTLLTLHRIRDQYGNAILDPEHATVAWCASCNQRLLPQESVTPCTGCTRPTCAHCAAATPETWCPSCWRATRPQRLLRWLLTINA